MSAVAHLADLAGDWAGSSLLWLRPDEPVRESETTACVGMVARGQFLTIHYTWAEEGEPQDGLLLFGAGSKPDAVSAVWVDSWHMGSKFMVCEGAARADGTLSATGSYEAPPGPDWGWRIELEPVHPDSFRIIMFNILPDGTEARAVEASYARRP